MTFKYEGSVNVLWQPRECSRGGGGRAGVGLPMDRGGQEGWVCVPTARVVLMHHAYTCLHVLNTAVVQIGGIPSCHAATTRVYYSQIES